VGEALAVANALTIKPSEDPDVLTVEGDAKPATADRIIEGALDRFAHRHRSITPACLSCRSPATPPRTTPWLSG
jgi:hypothetical protein